MKAAFAAFTHEVCLVRQDVGRLRDELQASRQETSKARQDARHLRARSAEACAANVEHLRRPEKSFTGRDERLIQEEPPTT